jgi:hypothetical protein
MGEAMKPIETRYHGHRFRSRLEARWAVFFDAFGVSWEYEPQGYDLGELGYYLPDFILDGRVIVEVKPPTYQASEEDWDRWNTVTELPGIQTFFLASGVPDGTRTWHGLEQSSNPLVGRYALARCEECYSLVFARVDAMSVVYTGARLCSSDCESRNCDLLDPYCEEIARATGARFEYGETPAIAKVVHYKRTFRHRTYSADVVTSLPAPKRPDALEDIDELTLPPKQRALYLELQSAIVEMQAASGRDKCKFFDRVIDLRQRWDKASLEIAS